MATRWPVPTLEEENAVLEAGHLLVAGVDEAGRGAWAGPVAAAAVVLPLSTTNILEHLQGVRDSKRLTPRARETMEARVAAVALGVGFGLASADEIDAMGIVPATRLAMERAIAGLSATPDFLLIDAVQLPDLPIPQKSIIKGDALSLSIAAASIVAKFRRDCLMAELDGLYPGYGFARHKGYGTRQHRRALHELGVCPMHRHSFQPVRERLCVEENR